MPQPAKCHADNVSVRHGTWGEEVAAEYLRRHGFEIIDRNVHPVPRDHRLEIDIIAWDREASVLVFVEVKQHKSVSPFARRMQSVDKRKRDNLRRACVMWRCLNKIDANLRFDVMEIYGVPQGGEPVIDHIQNVHLFGDRSRFVRWD